MFHIWFLRSKHFNLHNSCNAGDGVAENFARLSEHVQHSNSILSVIYQSRIKHTFSEISLIAKFFINEFIRD